MITAISKKKKFYKIIGVRPGEKIHEELINTAEIKDTLSKKDHFVVLSNFSEQQLINYCKKNKYKKVSKNFTYNSGTNTNFLTVKELDKIVKKYL